MLLYIPLLVRTWTLSSQTIRLQSTRRLSAKASGRCQARVRAGTSSSVVILSAAKDLIPVVSGDKVLRCAQDDNWRSETPLHLLAEQHHRAFRPVALEMPAPLGHRERLARPVGPGLALGSEVDRPLQHQRAHIEWMAVLGVHLRAWRGVGDDIVAVALQRRFEALSVHGPSPFAAQLLRAATTYCAPRGSHASRRSMPCSRGKAGGMNIR